MRLYVGITSPDPAPRPRHGQRLPRSQPEDGARPGHLGARPGQM